jgi:hypothetical protein
VAERDTLTDIFTLDHRHFLDDMPPVPYTLFVNWPAATVR